MTTTPTEGPLATTLTGLMHKLRPYAIAGDRRECREPGCPSAGHDLLRLKVTLADGRRATIEYTGDCPERTAWCNVSLTVNGLVAIYNATSVSRHGDIPPQEGFYRRVNDSEAEAIPPAFIDQLALAEPILNPKEEPIMAAAQVLQRRFADRRLGTDAQGSHDFKPSECLTHYCCPSADDNAQIGLRLQLSNGLKLLAILQPACAHQGVGCTFRVRGANDQYLGQIHVLDPRCPTPPWPMYEGAGPTNVEQLRKILPYSRLPELLTTAQPLDL